MFGFGWLKSLPWSRAQRTARARRELEEVMERSSVLARAVEEQVRHARLLERHKEEAAQRAAQKAEMLLVAERRAVIAQMQAERRARRGTKLADLHFTLPARPAPQRAARDDAPSTAAAETPALPPMHQHWGAAPVSSASESSCQASYDSGSSSYDSSSYDSGGSSDGGGCGGGD